MKSFKTFNISHFERDPQTLEAKLHYNFDNEEFFTEVLNFTPLRDQSNFPLINNNPDTIAHFLKHIHIAFGVSYYKLFPTTTIFVDTFQLSEDQRAFWHDFYIKGLGEFFYRNQLDPRGLGNFQSNLKKGHSWAPIQLPQAKSLVLFGGGKDSLVSVELLKKENQTFDLFSFGKDYPLHQVAQEPTKQKRLIISRQLDLTQLKKMGEQGYYNGHVPITGTICFATSLACYLYGYNQIITSLEKSADFGNTEYCGMEINHQRSKSAQFQNQLQNYFQSYLASNLECKSLIADRYEIKVVQELTKYPQYFQHFSSCNRNFTITPSQLSAEQLRCWVCPKCAFIYVLLRAFLGKEQTNQIFGKDLFENREINKTFEELLWISGIKPFECVGTNEEVVLAFWLIYQKEKKADSQIMQTFLEKIYNHMSESDFKLLESKLLD